LKAGVAQHYIGHNPAGGAMVIILLLFLTATTASGLKLYAIEENKGPFSLMKQQFNLLPSGVTTISMAKAQLVNNAPDDDDISNNNPLENNENDQNEEFWEDFHEICANFTLLLVLIHVGGVAISSWIDKENLVKAMITGKKEIDDDFCQ
jgi:cytochrome b